MRAARGAIGLAAVAVVLAGCAHTTAGVARPAPAPSSSPSGSGLDHVLLSAADINTIMGAEGMEIVDSSEEMADNRGDVDNDKCLGALYNAESLVYEGSGWTRVVDQVVTEPEDDSGHWVEQTAVQFPSAEQATKFLNTSKNQWTNCIGEDVVVNDGGHEFSWRLLGIAIDGDSVTQSARQEAGDGWSCQHVLRAVSDVVVEVAACGMSLNDEAVSIAGRIADRVK